MEKSIQNYRIMGFFGNLLSAAVKTALTPVAIVKDAADILSEGECNNVTGKNLDSALEDVGDAFDIK